MVITNGRWGAAVGAGLCAIFSASCAGGESDTVGAVNLTAGLSGGAGSQTGSQTTGDDSDPTTGATTQADDTAPPTTNVLTQTQRVGEELYMIIVIIYSLTLT